MKRIVSIFLSVIILCASAVTVYAHPNKHGGAILDTYLHNGNIVTGAESIGWGVKEFRHLNSHTATYCFDSGVATSYRTNFNQGAALWNDNTDAQLTLTTSSSANITVRMKTSSDTGIPATARAATGTLVSPDPVTGHTSQWQIIICLTSLTNIDCAHEFGHVFGLVDLESTSNVKTLMYYNSDNRKAKKPTEKDIKGFKFITGLHTNHSWVYRNNSSRYCSVCGGISTYNHPYSWSYYNTSKHKGYCSHCAQTVYVNHSWVNYHSINSTQHTKKCSVCNEVLSENHYNDTFISKNVAQHKIYCKCGKYQGMENHTPNATNTGCTKCDYVGSVGGTVSYPGDDE